MDHSQPRTLPLCITIEEHWLFKEFCTAGGYDAALRESFTPETNKKLLAADEGRIANMNATSIKTQVISHIPFDSPASDVRMVNEALYRAVKAHPSQFKAFAQLPMRNPMEAARELEYTIKTLGFVGALLPNHLNDGSFYDSASYDAVFAKAQELEVPLYLHPSYPSEALSKALYDGPWSDRLKLNLGGWCWGWHSTVGLHILRLFAAGVFERFSEIKIVIGHMGEMLPFMLDRIYPIAAHWPDAESRTRSLREVWDSNIWVTTSGMFSLAPMKCLLTTTKASRIIYSVDYPLAANEQGVEFLQKLQESGLVSEEELEDITHRNAARLLRLDLSDSK